MTLRDALQHATARLACACVDSPALSAQLLAAHALGRSRVQIVTGGSETLDSGQLAALDALLARRESGEPVAYILGEQEFYGLPFRVTPDVLIPRPETELIVDELLAVFASSMPLRFMDLGTGSGALAVALAHVFPKARGVALDISAPALAVARSNAAANGVAERLRFVQADFRCPLPGRGLDCIVANPPYVSGAEYQDLSREVAQFEPRGALLSGDSSGDGLDHVRSLAPHASQALRPGGVLLIEIGWRQGDAGLAVLRSSELPLRDVRVLPDLAGHDRVLMARRA